MRRRFLTASEGRRRIVQHVAYERSSKNRRLAIQTHGTTCAACEFDFDEFYGREYADGYIQIHHVKLLSQYEGEVNPVADLIPLCANCHVMAHRKKNAVTSVEDLKALIEEAKG
jgi:5-methylcytosine-specific restriction enzyme A